MREIKFRVWDGHKMNYDGLFDLGFGDYGSVLISLWGNVAVYEDDDGGKSGIHEHVVDGYNLNLMQFTGLKDRKGVEVYEGDIVGKEFHWDYYIGFGDGSYVMIPCNPVQRVNWEWQPATQESLDGREIIGNIFEHPELLEVF